ncbi:MAG: cupin domain-containing protein [Candidatus Hadarchaeia archaeon]
MGMVVRNKDKVEATTVKNIHGGTGNCIVRQVLGEEPRLEDVPGFPDDFKTNLAFIHWSTLEKGATIGRHPQGNSDEVYIILNGKGKMTVDGETVELGPGDACLTQAGSHHSFKNIGDEDIEFIVVTASTGEGKI